MKRCWLAVAMLAAGLLAARSEAAEKAKVLYLRGGGIHDWKAATTVLVPIFEKTGDFEVTLTEKLEDLNAENLKGYQLVLIHSTSIEFTSPEQEKALCDFVRAGGAWAGFHSATDSFKKSDAYWEMVGGRFAGHAGGKFTVYIIDKEHPITKGLEDFEIQDETYAHAYHKFACLRSLVRMNTEKERQSMAWVQDYGKGRVFYTGLGHGNEAWTNPAFQRLLVRGMYWAVGREPKDPQ